MWDWYGISVLTSRWSDSYYGNTNECFRLIDGSAQQFCRHQVQLVSLYDYLVLLITLLPDVTAEAFEQHVCSFFKQAATAHILLLPPNWICLNDLQRFIEAERYLSQCRLFSAADRKMKGPQLPGECWITKFTFYSQMKNTIWILGVGEFLCCWFTFCGFFYFRYVLL